MLSATHPSLWFDFEQENGRFIEHTTVAYNRTVRYHANCILCVRQHFHCQKRAKLLPLMQLLRHCLYNQQSGYLYSVESGTLAAMTFIYCGILVRFCRTAWRYMYRTIVHQTVVWQCLLMGSRLWLSFKLAVHKATSCHLEGNKRVHGFVPVTKEFWTTDVRR